jgi:hypothetical protein
MRYLTLRHPTLDTRRSTLDAPPLGGRNPARKASGDRPTSCLKRREKW